MYAQRTPTVVLYTFLLLNFIRGDIPYALNFTPTAQCSSNPSQAAAHMGPLRQAFFCVCRAAPRSHAVQRQKTQGWTVSAGRWLQRLSAALSITDAPGIRVCEIFSRQHSNTIDCPLSISRKIVLMFPASL